MKKSRMQNGGTKIGSGSFNPSGKMDSTKKMSKGGAAPKKSANHGGPMPDPKRGMMTTSEDGNYGEKKLAHPSPSSAMKTMRK